MKSLPMCRCILLFQQKRTVYIEAAFACGMRTAAVGYAAETVCGDWNFDKLSELVLKAV